MNLTWLLAAGLVLGSALQCYAQDASSGCTTCSTDGDSTQPAAASAAAGSSNSVYLSSLDLSNIHQGFGKPQADKSITGKPLSIAGKTFERGIGTHAVSTAWLDLAGGAQTS